jgi:hypothetical protein
MPACVERKCGRQPETVTHLADVLCHLHGGVKLGGASGPATGTETPP